MKPGKVEVEKESSEKEGEKKWGEGGLDKKGGGVGGERRREEREFCLLKRPKFVVWWNRGKERWREQVGV